MRPGPVSPTRPLSEQPTDRANRLLDFTKNKKPVRTTVEASPSPFKPRPAKSAKSQKTRKSIFNFDDDSAQRASRARSDSAELEKTVQEAQDAMDHIIESAVHSVVKEDFAKNVRHDQTMTNYDEEDDDDDEQDDSVSATIHTVQESATPARAVTDADMIASPLVNGTSSNQKRKREQPRPSDAATEEPSSRAEPEHEQKRRKSAPGLAHPTAGIEDPSHVDQTLADHTLAETSYAETGYADDSIDEPSITEHSLVDPTLAQETVVDPTVYESTVMDPTMADETVVDPTVYERTVLDPTLAETTVADDSVVEASEVNEAIPTSSKATTLNPKDRAGNLADDLQHVEEDVSSPEAFVPPPETYYEHESEHGVPPPKKRGRKSAPKQKPRKPSAPAERSTKDSDKPTRDTQSADAEGGPKKKGPKSLVQLRAGTPIEDDGATTTRSGRTSIKPLKYWCNESFIWRHGEVDGVVRADEINDGKQPSKRSKPKRKAGLGSIKEDEDEEDEDLLPEAWEDELGVINGRVRTWDSELGVGAAGDEVHEGMALISRFYESCAWC